MTTPRPSMPDSRWPLATPSVATTSASGLTTLSNKSDKDPELTKLITNSRKCHRAHCEQYWSAIDRWERTFLQEEGVVSGRTRGDLVDSWVSQFIAECQRVGFEIDDTQALRDAVFDYVRSVSYR